MPRTGVLPSDGQSVVSRIHMVVVDLSKYIYLSFYSGTLSRFFPQTARLSPAMDDRIPLPSAYQTCTSLKILL